MWASVQILGLVRGGSWNPWTPPPPAYAPEQTPLQRHLYVAMSSFPLPHCPLQTVQELVRILEGLQQWNVDVLQTDSSKWAHLGNDHELTPPNHNPMQWLKVDHFYLSSTLFHSCSIVQSFETIVSTFAQQSRNETFIFMTETILFVAELVSLIATISRRDL